MKIDLVLTNLELSGSIKYMGALASGFAALGHQVRYLYSGIGSGFSLVEAALGGFSRVRYAGDWTHWASRELLGSPVLRLFAKGTFDPSQSVNLIGNVIHAKSFDRLTRDTDVIVYVNTLAYPPPRLWQPRRAREVLIFHEGIEAPFLPGLPRRALQSYFRTVARRANLCMAITSIVRDRLRSQGIEAITIPHGFFGGGVIPRPKEPLILVDTRWVKERDPFRVIRIAEKLPGIRMIMIGRFADVAMRKDLENRLRSRGLSQQVELSPPLSEMELLALYGRARIVLRWAFPNMESGFSFSLVNAISSGCVPVMSSGLGGSRHLAEEVSPDLVQDSDEGLVHIIRCLLADEQYYNKMQSKVLSWRDRRQWNVVAETMLQEVLRGREGRRALATER